MVILLTDMYVPERLCFKTLKKTLNKTFKELQNEYPQYGFHIIYYWEGGGQKMRSYFQGGVGQLQSECVQGEGGSKKAQKLRS